MAFLEGKKILVTGLLSNRSIAYGIAAALKREGATLALTYQNEGLRGRVDELARDFGAPPVLACDVANDAEIAALFEALKREWGALDGIVHSIAFAPREALKVGCSPRHEPNPQDFRLTGNLPACVFLRLRHYSW